MGKGKRKNENPGQWKFIDDPLRNRIRKNSATSMLYYMLTFPLMFILTPFILEHVGKEVYGIWAIVGTILIFVELIGGVQTSSAMSVMVPKYDPGKESKDINEIVNTMFVFYLCSAIVIAALFFLLKSSLIQWFFKVDPSLIPVTEFILVFSFLMFLLNFVMLGVGYLLGAFNIFYFANILHIISSYIRAALIIISLIMGYGIEGVVVVQMSVLVVESLVILILTKIIYPPLVLDLRFVSMEKFKTMMVLSFKLLFNRTAVLFNYNVDKLILGYFISPVVAAYYHIGAGVTKYISQVPEMLGLSSLLPAASELKAKKQTEKIVFLYEKVNKYIFYIAFFLASGMIIFGKDFVRLWLGQGYGDVYTTFVILSLAYTFGLAGYAPMHLLNGMERIRETAMVSSITLVLNILFSVILTQRYGLMGALTGTAISMVFSGSALLIIFSRITGFRLNLFRVAFKPLLSIILSYAGILGFGMLLKGESWLFFFLKTGLYSILHYLLSVYVFRHIDEYDRSMFFEYFRSLIGKVKSGKI